MQLSNNFKISWPWPTLFTFSPQPFREISQCLPLRGVHVDVLAVTDVFVVHDVIVDSLGSWNRINIKRKYWT